MRPKLNVTVGGTGKQKIKTLFLQINAQHGHSRVELSFEKALAFPENHWSVWKISPRPLPLLPGDGDNKGSPSFNVPFRQRRFPISTNQPMKIGREYKVTFQVFSGSFGILNRKCFEGYEVRNCICPSGFLELLREMSKF